MSVWVCLWFLLSLFIIVLSHAKLQTRNFFFLSFALCHHRQSSQLKPRTYTVPTIATTTTLAKEQQQTTDYSTVKSSQLLITVPTISTTTTLAKLQQQTTDYCTVQSSELFIKNVGHAPLKGVLRGFEGDWGVQIKARGRSYHAAGNRNAQAKDGNTHGTVSNCSGGSRKLHG